MHILAHIKERIQSKNKRKLLLLIWRPDVKINSE
jgi:hypothetical protein